jgi:hypothetical protein
MANTFDSYYESTEAVIARGEQPPVVAGKTGQGAASAPSKADAARKKTLVAGLVDALNKFQAEISGPEKDKPQLYPDTYNIVIVDDVLQQAKVVPPGETNLKQVPMTQAQTANQQKNPATQKVDNNAKTTKVIAGTSIVQFLDQLVRTSTYIYDQQIAQYDPKTKELKPNGSPAETVGWYRIGLEATPQLDKFDTKRNDYAYDITYQLNIYAVSDVKSDFFPSPKFRGTQKKYNYWFTGENTQILDFNQDFNYLYYIVSNGPRQPRTTTSDFREVEKRYYQVNSPQSSQGQDDDKVNEPSANAADYLYSPGDQSRVKLKIIGDPAWIFQGETWSGIQGLKFNYGPFLPDGTINYEGQEILFELAWNKPVDYDLETGIQDPTTNNFKKSATAAGDARQSYVYQAIECTSTFSRGKFEQDLNGVLKIYPIPQSTARTEARPAEQTVRSTTAPTAAKKVQARPNATAPTSIRANTEDLAVTDTLSAEGFGDIVAPSPPPTAPTSGGQTVGAAASGAAAVASQGGASGKAVGQPVAVPVFTNQGVVNATSNEQIQGLYSQGRISAQERNQAAQGLAIKQRAANSPVTSQPRQISSRET